MTNAIKKRLNRKGFTLAEVLVTVAIIIILAGVTFVSVGQYQKNLRLMEMDGTAKEIFIAAQNHLSVAKASGDLDRLAVEANASSTGTTASAIGTKLDPTSVSAYAGNASGEYYYVIHNVTSGTENYTPQGSDAILQMMLPFGALDETVSASGNYAIVYELKSASVVAVLYSGAGNASFGNAAVITLDDDDVKNIETKKLYQDKSARKSYQKDDVTAIVGCYTGTAGSAAIPTETLEAPKLEVKNENKLHVIVSDTDKTAGTDNVTLIIRGVQSGTVAQRLLQRDTSDGHIGAGAFDVTIDDITGDDGSYRFANIISPGRFKATTGAAFIPGENIEISARVSSTTGLATPKESAKYTVSSLFGDVNETKDAAGNTTVYIRNLRHLENLGANVSGFTAALGTGTTSGSSKIVNITAEQKNEITMFSMSTSGAASGNHFENLYGSKIYGMEQEATFAAIDVNYPLVYHGNQHEIHDVSIGAQTGYSAAGIFGRVADLTSGEANASLSVRDLILRNDRVSGTNVQNAGMLVGETTKDLTVDGVLAYYHEDSYDETRDSSVEVTASENAGGLIGLVAGGKLDVKNSAAAVYVKGGSAAGGFIGSVTGAETDSTIVQSYAGGHTKDGAYSTTDAATNRPVLEGPGRYNVQASGYAGGFIGESSDKVNMNAVYSTASAYSNDATKSGSFSGNTKAIFGTGNNYYAIGPHNGTEASADDIAKAEITTGQVRRQATPYDRKLILKGSETEHKTMDKTSYPLCTVRNLCEGDASVQDTDLPWFIKEHVGDWVVSKKTTGKLEIKNDVRLELDFTTSDTSTKTIFFTITGVTSQKTLKLMIDVTADNGNDVSFATHVVQDGKFNTYWNTGSKKMAVRKTEDGAGYKYILYLDDITTDGGHFAKITEKSGLILGEDLNITVSECTIQNYAVTNIKQIAEEKVNSLFDHVNLTTGTAYISSARHLENLDKYISGINVQPSVDIKNAVIMNDILWKQELNGNDAGEAGFVEKIKTTTIESAYKDTATVRCWNQAPPCEKDACYVPITNDNLQVMNGQYEDNEHKLINFDMHWNNVDNRHCGLFRKVNNNLTIENLTLRHVQSESASDAFTGALVGTVDNQAATVNVYNVHVEGKCVINGGAAAAGGLIGHTNGAVSVVQSDIANAIVTSTGNSGGLIGETGDGVTNIKEVSCDGEMSVKGKNASGGIIGQTNQAKVTVDTAKFLSKVEVTSDNTHAGGVIGISGGEVEIKNTTFNGKLTVSGANSSGGIIGNANGKVTVDRVTFDSDVTVEATSANVHAGGIVGYANGEAEIKNTTFNGKLTVSGDNSSAGIIGNANAKATVKYASFQSDVMVKSTNDHAAGVLGITNNHEADIENVTFSGKLNIYGNKSSGGILGNTGSKLKLCDISIGGGSTIASFNGDAGGVVGFAQSYDADIQNIKFIGKDTKDTKDTKDAEVIAKGNAGGLCGVLIENNKLTISNVAVSAFIQAEQNAGGLIGRLQTSAPEGKIEKSYYGGRTKGGQYASITITINNNTKEYKSNIHGSQKAGGLIGSIEKSHGLTISECFSTGSVENGANDQNAGGFIGAAEQSGIKINNCYSIGKVSSQNNGGFIGYRSNSNDLTYENVYYLNTFNDPSVKAIGNGTDDENNNLTTKYADNVLGKNEKSDLTVQTNYYDGALKGEIYPYKNWTTDWKSTESSKPIAYYGDWPLPSKLTGEFIYFHAKDSANYEKGGLFKVTGQNTNVECYMTPIANLNLQKYGFGIISEYPITDKTSYDNINDRYTWSTSLDGEFKKCKTEGSPEKPKYSVFTYFGKTYYYYRCTTNGGLNIDSGLIYVREKKDNQEITYQVSVSDGEARFKVAQVKDV